MKKLFLFIFVLLLTLSAFSQSNAIDELIEKYSERDGFTLVTISSKMFSMMANLVPEEDRENKEAILPKLNSIRILSVSDSLLNKNINFYNELSKKIDLSVYEDLMSVKEGANRTRILIKHSTGDRIGELLLITGGPAGNTIISIRGDLSMKNISDLSKNMDIKELEGLEKQGKKKPGE